MLLRLRIWSVAVGLLAVTSTAWASHVPVALDVPDLWTGMPGDGYLEFINPTEHPGLVGTPVFSTPPGAIFTEEHTGYTLAPPAGSPFGVDVIEVGDSDTTAGDRADYDWVQEHRSDELAIPAISNHPGLVGAMGWTPGSPEFSPHIDPGTGLAHGHSVAEVPAGLLPELENDVYEKKFFRGVDVFSIISEGEDSDPTPRDSALDYILDFGNTITGFSTPGVPIKVWIPGWDPGVGIDDFVARWVPFEPGLYNVVAIEPAFGPDHDEITEIDAIKAFIPEPSTLVLGAIALMGLLCYRLRRPQTS